MPYVCLLTLIFAGLLAAQDGASLYKQRCAVCHDAPKGRIPDVHALKQVSGETIYAALSNGVMKSQASGLTREQMEGIADYLAPGGSASVKIAFQETCAATQPFNPDASAAWPGWSPSVTNSRFQGSKAAGLTEADVPKLKLKWAFNLGPVTLTRGQPAVTGDRVFFGAQTGEVYSIDRNSGCIYWAFKAATAIRSGVAAGDVNGVPAVFFGDGGANIYALNAATGALFWKARPESQSLATTTATPQFYRGVLYQGFSSIEEMVATDPKYACCSFRGSVAALDAATGKTLWHSYTVGEVARSRETAQHKGPSGAGVWSTPTIDERRGAVYVATGDNYSEPVTQTSDAVLAFDLKTGQLLWSRQFTQGDAYNVSCGTQARSNCPEKGGPDFDFAQPPILVQLGAGRRALVIGQKSAMVHAIDPDQHGKILWQTRVGTGGTLGGSQWGSAADHDNMYVAISDVSLSGVADAKSPAGFRLVLDPRKGGGLYALDLKSGSTRWSAKPVPCAELKPSCSPAQSAAVTAITGAVFSGALDGHLRAYSTHDGRVIWDFDTAREFPVVNGNPAHGGSIDATGAAVVNGMVLVSSGYNQFGGMAGNVLLAFTVEGK